MCLLSITVHVTKKSSLEGHVGPEAEDGSGERYTIRQMNQMEEHDVVWSGRCQTTTEGRIKGVNGSSPLPRRVIQGVDTGRN